MEGPDSPNSANFNRRAPTDHEAAIPLFRYPAASTTTARFATTTTGIGLDGSTAVKIST